jgi:hypothetical protein
LLGSLLSNPVAELLIDEELARKRTKRRSIERLFCFYECFVAAERMPIDGSLMFTIALAQPDF